MNVAILGLGVVGFGVYEILQEQKDINISYVLDRNQDLTASVDAPVASSFSTILDDPNVDIVIELIGGMEPAYQMITQALQKGKHVVTANKAVISKHFKALHELAKQHHVHLLYEASVGGGMIVLDSLKTIAPINRIHSVEGIVNGATNYILSSIYHDGNTLDVALKNAFELGYIETGTTDDMDGLDAMRKIHILSMLSYRTYLQQDEVDVISLSSVSSEMMNYVKSIDHEMKYIVTSSKTEEGVHMAVLPTIYPRENRYQSIQYEENMITIFGQHHKKQTIIGQGAGRYPTGSAIVYNVLQIKQGTVPEIDLTEDHNLYRKNMYRFLVETSDGFHISEPQAIADAKAIKEAISIARWEGLQWNR